MRTPITINGALSDVRTVAGTHGTVASAKLVQVDRYRSRDGIFTEDRTTFNLLALGSTADALARFGADPGRKLEVDGDLITLRGRHYIRISTFTIIH